MRKYIGIALICTGPVVCWAACPTWPAVGQSNARFTLNATGTEVNDSRTGMVWKRCSEGQVLSLNTCIGSAAIYTHQEAIAIAQKQNGWRLPNLKELVSLSDRGCMIPAIDNSAFPNTPSILYWTSSPQVGSSNRAWVVHFYNGGVPDENRSNSGAVRLVRMSQ